MTVIRYSRDGRHWDKEEIESPDWTVVENAVRRMDNYCFPIVQLNTAEDDDADDVFSVVGGNGRWALFHVLGEWQYEDPEGSESEARLWESDQGYFCQEKNVLSDLEKVLRIVKAFYETGSYSGLNSVL